MTGDYCQILEIATLRPMLIPLLWWARTSSDNLTPAFLVRHVVTRHLISSESHGSASAAANRRLNQSVRLLRSK